MIRAVIRPLFGIATAVTVAANGWVLAQSPFTAPFRARTEAELSVALDRELQRSVTPPVIEEKIAAALADGSADEAAAILRLADARAVAVLPETRATVVAAEEAATGWSTCIACAISTEACPDLTRMAACNLPVELTPVGDAKAITRALTDYISGRDIDKIDLSLGVIGLGSTVAILASGGTSYSVKAGATALRVARKSGAISAGLMRELTDLARGALRLDRARDVLRGAAKPSVLIDGRQAARLTEAASAMGRLSAAMPAGDAFAVLRRAENTEDLARIARVADSAGPETRGTFAVLGTSRTLRLAHRLSELTLLALGLLAALLSQLLTIALWLIRRWLAPRRRKVRI